MRLMPHKVRNDRRLLLLNPGRRRNDVLVLEVNLCGPSAFHGSSSPLGVRWTRRRDLDALGSTESRACRGCEPVPW
jgi:hypothetical protein